MSAIDKLKTEVVKMVDDAADELRGEVKAKLDDIFNDELQKDIVDTLNKAIDVPFISERMEARAMNFLYDVFEEKFKAAIKKVL